MLLSEEFIFVYIILPLDFRLLLPLGLQCFKNAEHNKKHKGEHSTISTQLSQTNTELVLLYAT